MTTFIFQLGTVTSVSGINRISVIIKFTEKTSQQPTACVTSDINGVSKHILKMNLGQINHHILR